MGQTHYTTSAGSFYCDLRRPFLPGTLQALRGVSFGPSGAKEKSHPTHPLWAATELFINKGVVCKRPSLQRGRRWPSTQSSFPVRILCKWSRDTLRDVHYVLTTSQKFSQRVSSSYGITVDSRATRTYQRLGTYGVTIRYVDIQRGGRERGRDWDPSLPLHLLSFLLTLHLPRSEFKTFLREDSEPNPDVDDNWTPVYHCGHLNCVTFILRQVVVTLVFTDGLRSRTYSFRVSRDRYCQELIYTSVYPLHPPWGSFGCERWSKRSLTFYFPVSHY